MDACVDFGHPSPSTGDDGYSPPVKVTSPEPAWLRWSRYLMQSRTTRLWTTVCAVLVVAPVVHLSSHDYAVRSHLAHIDDAITALSFELPAPPVLDLPVYYINRDSDRDRRAAIEDRIAELYPPSLRRIPGVNGRLHLEEEWAHSGFRWETAGELGCTLSHLAAAKQLVADGHAAALIAEDDAHFAAAVRWPFRLSELVAQLPPGWTTLQLFHGTDARHAPRAAVDASVGATVVPYGDRGVRMPGTVAYLLSRRGAEALMRLTNDGRTLHRSALGTRDGRADTIMFEFPGASAYAVWPRHVFPYNDLGTFRSTVYRAARVTLRHTRLTRSILEHVLSVWPAANREGMLSKGAAMEESIHGDERALVVLDDFLN